VLANLSIDEAFDPLSGFAEVGRSLDTLDCDQLSVESAAIAAEVAPLEKLSIPNRKRANFVFGCLVHFKNVIHQLIPGVELQRKNKLVDVDRQNKLVVVNGIVETLVVGQDLASPFLPNFFSKKCFPLCWIIW
jgi:hypothetical protein